MTTLLIDADGVAFRAASAVETSIAWDDDIHTNHADLKEAIRSFESLMSRIIDGVGRKGNHEEVMCFSCPTRTYFRHHILPTYKGNRKAKPPLVLKALKAWIEENYKTYTKPHLEADDVLGVLMTNRKVIPGRKIIVSTDKDLLQIAGEHYDPLHPEKGVFPVFPEPAEMWLWMQVLMGDTVDGYTGCPGVGPVKAEALFKAGLAKDLLPWQIAHQAFHKAGLSDEQFVQQVNVARIIQSHCYDYQDKEPILWELPSEKCSTNAKPLTAPTVKSAGSRKPSSERTRTRPTGKPSRTTRKTP